MGTAEPSRNVKYSSSTSFQQESYKTESDQKSDLVNDYAHAEEELSEAEADTENSEANIKNSNILHENYGYVKDFIVQKMEEHDIANEKMVGRPLGIGTFVMSKCSIDNKYHTAQILERRHTPGGGKELEYYVHYTQFDRRLDEWVKRERIELDTGSDGHTMDYNKAKNLKMTRQQKRKMGNNQIEDHENMDEVYLREHEEITKVKNIKTIELGRYEMDAWYFSPFPREFESCEKLFFCEFCLTYLKKKEQLQRHMRKCQLKYPPGNEIYRHETLSVFEVDGAKHRVYSENLCQLAKLFLDHKYVYNEVGGFLFYILCECDHRGCHVVAYFSKEKESLELYNLACILTLPPYQKKGYGKFLIAFSYELSKKEGKHGTPERPLSDLGSLSYKHYWTRVLLNIIKNQGKNFTIKALADMTSIKVEDIVETLTSLKLIEYQKGVCTICTDPNVLDSHLASLGNSGLPVHIEKLQWTPYQEQ